MNQGIADRNLFSDLLCGNGYWIKLYTWHSLGLAYIPHHPQYDNNRGTLWISTIDPLRRYSFAIMDEYLRTGILPVLRSNTGRVAG